MSKDEWSGCDPVEDSLDVMRHCARGQWGAVDHQHRQVQAACRNQLGLCPAAPRVFGDNQVYVMGAHQSFIRGSVKRAAIKDDVVIGQRWRGVRRIDKAQKVVVLGLRSEGGQVQPAQRQQDAPGRAVEGLERGGNIGDALPSVAGLWRPGRAGQCQKGRAGQLRGFYRMGAHLCCERMRGVHQMRDGVVAQIGSQTINAAKAADAHRHRLGFGPLDPACIAERRGQTCCGQFRDKACGLDCAAKDKDIGHV